MNYVLLLVVLILLSPLSLADYSDVTIKCKVLDQAILSLEDGKSTRYIGFEEGAKIGEDVSFSFSFYHFPSTQTYEVQIDNSQYPAVLIARSILNSSLSPKINNAQIVSQEKDQFGNEMTASLGESYLRIEGGMNGHTITGSRYYKNDWHFFVKGGVATETHFLQTLNCMNVPSSYSEMLTTIHSYLKRN